MEIAHQILNLKYIDSSGYLLQFCFLILLKGWGSLGNCLTYQLCSVPTLITFSQEWKMPIENSNEIIFKLLVADVNSPYAFFLCLLCAKAKELKLYVLIPALTQTAMQ